MVASKTPTPTTNLVLAVVLLCLGWLAAHAGIVPIFGLLAAAFAPDIFLIGLLLLAIWLARTLPIGKVAAGLLAVVLSILIGLNTRLPTLVSDIRRGSASDGQVISHLDATVGQPIHVVAQTPETLARRYPYSHAAPACYGDGCIVTKGFRTPYPWIEGDYWHEKVMDVVLAAGFSKANRGESAPTLTIRQDTDEYLSNVHIELLDADGKLLSRYDGRYRNGFPYETKDGIKSDGMESQSLILQFLLHGNVMNRLAALLLPKAEAYPLASFLKGGNHLRHPQGATLGLVMGRPPLGSEPVAEKVALEVLEDKTYDPVWIIKEEPLSNISKWSEMSWDKVRGDRCNTLLRPEIPGAPLLQTWHLFVNDPSGRKKVRYAGDAICDPDAIWFLDYVIEKGRTSLTKYSITGDLIYRVSFEKPKEPWGYPGGIPIPTFKAEGGYLQFEWWNTNQSGRDRHVKRSLKVRLKEPDTTPNIAVERVTPLAVPPLAPRPSP